MHIDTLLMVLLKSLLVLVPHTYMYYTYVCTTCMGTRMYVCHVQ